MAHEEEKGIEEMQSLVSGSPCSFTDEECGDVPSPARLRGRQGRILPCSMGLVLALMLSNAISIFLGAIWAWSRIDFDHECAAYTTQHSPILTEADVKYDWKIFNGSFMHENIYRQKGSPTVDAAWEELGLDARPGVVPYQAGIEAGLTPAHVQRADKYGGGFFVNVEGLHHLHCLNLVRKSLYYNYDYYKMLGTHAFVNDDDILQLHVSHCLDILRQVLMCNVDTGLLGQVWVNPEKPSAFPDFETRHRCKNFDDIKVWAVNHREPPPDELPPDYLKLPDQGDVLPTTP